MGVDVQTEIRIFRQHQKVLVLLSVLAVGMAIFLKSVLFLAVSAGMVVVFWGNHPLKFWRVLGVAYLAELVMLVRMGRISFPMMPQAMVLYDSNPNIWMWCGSGHPHAVRLLISYPGVIVAELLEVPLEVGCSLYTIFCFFLCYMLMGSTVTNLQDHKCQNSVPIVALLLPMNILPLIMNGRLVFSLCGISIALFTSTKVAKHGSVTVRYIVQFAFGILLCMVSTGTMMVCLLATAFFILWAFGASFWKNKSVVLFSGVLILCMIPYVLKMIRKLFTFWGGGLSGILGILHHGLGSKLVGIPFVQLVALLGMLAAAVPICIIILSCILSKKASKMRYYVLLIYGIVACCCFPVGMSAGMMCIVPAMVYTCCLIDSLWSGGGLKLTA